MRVFWILSALFLLLGLGWLTFARPYPVPATAVWGDRVVYASERSIRYFGDHGTLLGGWTSPRPVRSVLAAGDRLGVVFAGSDDLNLFTTEGARTGTVAAPQKAGGTGRWADAGDRWLFLHPARAALFVGAKAAPDWKLMLPPEEELTGVTDLAAVPGGAALLFEEPPQILWYDFAGEPRGDLELTTRLLPSVRYYILEDVWDYLKTQQARRPWRLAASPDGERLLLVFRTNDDKYRRLAVLWKEKDEWRSRGIILPSVAGRFRTSRPPQDVAFRGQGLVMSGRQGGLWLYPDDRLAPLKAWVEAPPPGRWERMRHQRRWGWMALAIAVLWFWAALVTRNARVVIPKESFLWAAASAVLPGAGSLWGRDLRWGSVFLLAAILWAGFSVGLMIQMGRGAQVTTVTLFESFGMLALTWAFSIGHAFRLGMRRARAALRPDPGRVRID